MFVVSRFAGAPREIGVGQSLCWSQDGTQVLSKPPKQGSEFVWINKVTGEEKPLPVPAPARESVNAVDCSLKTGRILIETNSANKYQLWTMKSDGTEQRKLFEDEQEIQSPLWSWNGEAIYYLRPQGQGTSALVKISISSHSTESAVLVSGLEAGESVSGSADGSRLAYTRVKHYSNLWLSDVPSRGAAATVPQKALTYGTSSIMFPIASPDGRWIAFMIGAGHKVNIYKMALNGGAPIQLTFLNSTILTTPAWSPDGEKIAFVCDQGGTPKVWVVNSSGGNPYALEKTNASDTNGRISWAPYAQIVYQQPGIHNYRRVNLGTGTEEPLLPKDADGVFPLRPVFSPDKKSVAVYWNRPEHAGTWAFSLEDFSERLVYPGPYLPISWSPDGKYVYLQGVEQPDILEVRADNAKEVRKIMKLRTFGFGLTLTPDARRIITNQDEQQSDVWVMENFDPTSAQKRASD
jgi:WD40 repeat protein